MHCPSRDEFLVPDISKDTVLLGSDVSGGAVLGWIPLRDTGTGTDISSKSKVSYHFIP